MVAGTAIVPDEFMFCCCVVVVVADAAGEGNLERLDTVPGDLFGVEVCTIFTNEAFRLLQPEMWIY